MDQTPSQITEKVRSGEYFREAQRAYADMYVDPMSQRYFYLFITLVSLVIFCIVLYAMTLLYPLSPQVPFIYMSQNMDEELPRMSALGSADEKPDYALKRYLVSEYVMRRESYNINALEINVRVVRAMSSPEVYNTWQKELDPANSQSPIAQFERHTIRRVHIVSITQLHDGTFDIVYDALISGDNGQKKLRYMANIALRFTEVTVDQNSGKATPVEFVVTGYQTRRVEE